jgi:hypothetical protein
MPSIPPTARRLTAAMVLTSLVAGGASAASGSSLRLTGTREDNNRPGQLRVIVGFSGSGLRANRVVANDFTHPGGDPTTLATASLTISQTAVASVPVLRAPDGTIIRVTHRGTSARLIIEPKAGRYKYLYYRVADRQHILILLWRSVVPAAPAYAIKGYPPGCLTLSHSRRSPGRITVSGTEHGIFEHQFTLALRGRAGRQLSHTTVHAVNGVWNGTLSYHLSHEQWVTLEAVAASPKDEAIACIAQAAVKLQLGAS